MCLLCGFVVRRHASGYRLTLLRDYVVVFTLLFYLYANWFAFPSPLPATFLFHRAAPLVGVRWLWSRGGNCVENVWATRVAVLEGVCRFSRLLVTVLNAEVLDDRPRRRWYTCGGLYRRSLSKPVTVVSDIL